MATDGTGVGGTSGEQDAPGGDGVEGAESGLERLYWGLLGLYTTLFVGALFLSLTGRLTGLGDQQGELWFPAGLVIGAIYVFIAFHYYWENTLVPVVYGVRSPIGRRAEEINKRRDYKFQLSSWVSLSIAMQLFTMAGFWVTLCAFPMNRISVFTSPVPLGQVYEQTRQATEAYHLPAALSQRMAALNITPSSPAPAGGGGASPAGAQPPAAAGAAPAGQGGSGAPAAGVVPEQLRTYIELVVENHLGPELTQQCRSGSPSGCATPEARQTCSFFFPCDLVSAIDQFPFYIAFAFGFLGVLLYTLQDAILRFNTHDLYPKTLFRYLVRYLFALTMCLVVAYYYSDGWPVTMAPLLFFFIGFFPQRVMQWAEQKASEFLSLKRDGVPQIPLDRLQGMNDNKLFRFQEQGIMDAQNLAFVDLDYLAENVGFSNRELGDFISQAYLLIHLGENDFSRVQQQGVRGIVQFAALLEESRKDLTGLESKLGLADNKVAVLAFTMSLQEVRERISEIATFMAEGDQAWRPPAQDSAGPGSVGRGAIPTAATDGHD